MLVSGAQLERYGPLFETFAVTAAHGAETAPEVWAEVEEARKHDPRRELFGLKLMGLLLVGMAVAGAIGIPLDLHPDIILGAGALLGMVFAGIWAARGGASNALFCDRNAYLEFL
jgi:hypothetical protein